MQLYRIANVLVCAIAIVLIISCGSNEVEKAKEFIEAGMYPQAISLLEKRLNDKPNDAEAHYLLGVSYIHTGNFGGAAQRFDSAIKMKPDYGFQIGGEYLEAGKESLSKGQTANAEQLFSKAIEYQRDLVVDVSKLYDDQKDLKAIISGLKFRKQAIPQNADLIQSQENALRELAKTSSVVEMRKIVPQYGNMLSEDIQKELAPPPEWKDVPNSVETHIGKGLTKNGIIEIKKPTFQIGDEFVVLGKHFQALFLKDGKWQWIDFSGEFRRKYKNTTIRSYGLKFRAVKGVKLTSKVRRFY